MNSAPVELALTRRAPVRDSCGLARFPYSGSQPHSEARFLVSGCRTCHRRTMAERIVETQKRRHPTIEEIVTMTEPVLPWQALSGQRSPASPPRQCPLARCAEKKVVSSAGRQGTPGYPGGPLCPVVPPATALLVALRHCHRPARRPTPPTDGKTRPESVAARHGCCWYRSPTTT